MASNTILLPDKTSFNWLILNLLGHDFYHDYNNIVTRIEAIEQDVIIELDLLIDNYHVLRQANHSPAALLEALESEKGQPYAVMLGGGGKEENEQKSGEEDGNNDVELDPEEYEEKMAESQKTIEGKIVMVQEGEEEGEEGQKEW